MDGGEYKNQTGGENFLLPVWHVVRSPLWGRSFLNTNLVLEADIVVDCSIIISCIAGIFAAIGDFIMCIVEGIAGCLECIVSGM